jgi:hypothetical protein
MISDAEPFALTGVVVTDILQGLTRDAALRSIFRNGICLSPVAFAPTAKQQRFFAWDEPRA